jgi:hypothetical protein
VNCATRGQSQSVAQPVRNLSAPTVGIVKKPLYVRRKANE